ncbi:MAG: Smr/MutS family protein [Parvularculales bacterium]
MPHNRYDKNRKDTRSLTSQEQDLWQSVTAGVSPLSSPMREKPLKSSGRPRQELSPKTAIGKSAQKSGLMRANLMKDGLDGQTERRIRRGQINCEARLDLHGFRRRQAYKELMNFITRSRVRKLRCVLVITGKGPHTWGEDPRGILRSLFMEWLENDTALSEHIIGSRPAHPRHGGSGAFYLWLRHP